MRRIWIVLFPLMVSAAQAAPVLRVAYTTNINGSSAYVTWSGSPTNNVKVYRATTYPNWDSGTLASGDFSESLPLNTVRFYKVQPVDANQVAVGPPSNNGLVCSYRYTDDPLAASSLVKALHIVELRTAINAVRVAAGLTAASWSPSSVVSGTHFTPAVVNDLRSALSAAFQQIQLTPPPFVDGTILGTTPVRRNHIQQLRMLTTAYPLVAGATLSVSERYFSPNNDGTKDTTNVNATAHYTGIYQNAPVRYTLRFNDPSGAAVRTVSGEGSSIAYVWNGRNASNGQLPDGDYAVALSLEDEPAAPLASAIATIDNTAPAVSITSPASGFYVSNIRLNGSGNVGVQGTANDAHFSGWSLSIVNGSPFQSGTTTTVSGTWNSLNQTNGPATIRLTGTDLAGNNGQADLPVTVGHFSASQNVYQLQATAAESVIYTSNVPYAVSGTITVKSLDTGQVVRTLYSGPLQVPTDTRAWDGRDGQGANVPDGRYQYFIDVVDGAYSMRWDASAMLLSESAPFPQRPYARCIAPDGSLPRCDDPGLPPFDPYANKPLRIVYCVGGGEPSSVTTCIGQTDSLPANVLVKATPGADTNAACSYLDCALNDWQSAGAHVFPWYGRSYDDSWDLSNAPYLMVIRRHASWPSNMTLVYGQAPAITDLVVRPLQFDPGWTSTLSGQDFVVSVSRSTSRPAAVKAQFRNMQSGSVLRTITSSPSTAAQQTVHWDGRADNGERVAPGLYQVVITAYDTNGTSLAWKPLVRVRY